MAIQTDNLVMAALGVVDDKPPNSTQPGPLTNGIHLRFAFAPEQGFPAGGYFLFRGDHGVPDEDCVIGKFKSEWQPGPGPSTRAEFSAGVFSSDADLVLLDQFTSAGWPELDLRGRKYLRFDLPKGELSRTFFVKLGMIGPKTETPTKQCVEFSKLSVGPYPNPYIANEVSFTAFEATFAAAAPQQTKNCQIERIQGVAALLNPKELNVRLPIGASSIEIDLIQATASTQFSALDDKGNVIVQKTAGSGPAKQTIQLSAGAKTIVSAKILADGIQSFIVRFCYIPKAPSPPMVGPINVRALDGEVVVALTTVSGNAGTVAIKILAGDRMTAVEIDGGPGALIDICTVPITRSLAYGWTPLLEQPLCLPVEHADYACPGKPTTFAQAQSLAKSRVQYPPPPNFSAQSFFELNSLLNDLVEHGPTGGPMAGRKKFYHPDTPAPDAPNMPELRPLDVVLIASLHPAIAMMLGLYFIDTTAQLGAQYDYMVMADHGGKFHGDPAAALLAWTAIANGQVPIPEDLDVWITFQTKLEPAPPLSPPVSPSVYALPGAITGTATTGTGRNMAGLRWQIDAAPDGTLLPNGPIGYHLWRANLGANQPSSPPATTQFNVLTADRLIFATETPLPTGATRNGASDWPPFPLIGFDPGLQDGWYSYCLSAVNIWGQHSALGPPGSWFLWWPAPTPMPWYYKSIIRADGQVHPFAICLLDKTPPSRVPGVEADALDPDDRMLLRDAAVPGVQTGSVDPEKLILLRAAAFDSWWTATESAWWNQPTTNRDQVLPLRVRWKWTFSQMVQAPDTKEFRIYFNPGTELPAPDYTNPTNWQDRIYVVAYNDHVTQTTDGDGQPLRLYEVLLPVPGDDTLFPGVPLAPSETEPIVYAHIGVTAADDKKQTADDPTRDGTAWGNRPGNEGRLGAPAKIYRVDRSKPLPPAAVDDSEKVWATRADYHSRSYYTFRWPKSGTLKAHIFRALDDTLFQVDWDRRASDSSQIDRTNVASFPISTWDQSTRNSVAAELNALRGSGSFDETVRATYQALSNNALRTLAGLPGNEKAFTQITYIPLDPADPANVDRAGPDGSDTYVPDASLRAYTAQLDGRAQNRYFYRAAYVNAAHTIGPLGRSGPPVYLPKITPLRTPRITKVLGGDRQITITWASNREPDLAEYRIYRSDNERDTRDIRLMDLVGTVPEIQLDPVLRAREVVWLDTNVLGLKSYYYRLTSRDDGKNESLPTPASIGKAFDVAPPPPPTWLAGQWENQGSALVIMLSWDSVETGTEVMVQRKESLLTALWNDVSLWLDDTQTSWADAGARPYLGYTYRLRARSAGGNTNTTWSEFDVASFF
jgi:hypothetical protein